MGVVVKNYAFLVLLGRRGILNETLQTLHLTDGPLTLLYTPTAVVIGMLYTMLPYAVLPLYAVFLTIPMELPQAAESLGASRTQAMSSVVAPLAVPGLFATGVIVYVLSLGFYVTPVILGGPRATFMATLIQNDIFLRFDPVAAATAGTLLVVIVTVVLIVASKLIGGDRLRRALA
jgi:putative spermidine/putrescine transport system permease protein